MARLIPQKQIEEINIFKDNVSANKSVFISGSLIVSQSINIGSELTTPQSITGSVEITGSLEIDGNLIFANSENRLDATASFADESVDTQRFGGILAKDFGESDATLYVSSTNGSDDNDGRTPQFPLRTIKKAAKIATDGDDGRYGLPTGSLFSGFAIKIDTGTYLEENPIELPKNTTVWGSGLRVTKVLAKNENEDLFWVNSGNYLSEMTFGNLRVFPSVDVSEKGFAVAFAPNAFITTSPYVQNCSMISNQENSFLEAYEEIPAGGGGLNVDGNRIHPDSPLASMVLDAYTQIAPNGVGCQVVGRGFIQLVSFFTNFSAYSVKVVDGGQAVLLNSNTSFGDFGMYASGSRFITGSGGNGEAFFNVQNNYSIIVDTIKNGLTSIPDLVPNTFEGRRLTDPNEVPQYFVSEDSTIDVAERVKSDFRIVSSIVEDGITNVPKLLAKSGKGGYGPESLYNVGGKSQYVNEATASNTDVQLMDTNFDIILDIIERGNNATSSYVQADNVSSSIKISDTSQYSTFAVQSTTNENIVERFDTVISIIENGLTTSPIVSSSTMAGYTFTDTTIYETDITSSLETIQSVSSSFALVYDILANGTGSLPTTILSSSVEKPSVDVQNAYTLLIENIPFIQDETIAYLSSSWSEHPYNQETCKRDVGFIISSSAHDLLFGGNEESIRSGVFYYQFPSNATTTEKDPTLTGVKYASELAINILDGKVFSEASSELDNAYDVIYQNKDFVREETIAYISSSWSEFEYSDTKCKRDIGYILDAVATDIHYGGNERSVIAGEFYYQYPSLAIVDNRTTGQLQQTLDAVKYAKRITQKLANNETFILPSASVLAAVNLIKENRSLIQNETTTYIDTQYPNFSYDRVKCRRDVGYIVDNVVTDLLYGGNERSELAGLYYFKFPSIANTTQLEETLEAIRYTKEFTKAIAKSIVLETPQVILNDAGNIRVTSFEPTTGSISATDTEVQIVSQSFGIIEDIIRYGTDSVLSSIAGNSEDYIWNLENPLNVSGIAQITSDNVATEVTENLVTSNFDTVIKIIESGSSIETEQTIGTDSKGNPISTVGIPKSSYGDNLVTTTIGTTIPSDITLVKNTEAGIKFGSGVQISSSISVDSTTINKVSSSFSTVSNIIQYGVSGSLNIIGSSDASTNFEVVTLYDDSFSIAKTQIQKFDDVDGKILGEDTGSFDDSVKDPTLTLKRGDLYTFSINSLSNVNAILSETQPFIIATNRSTDTKYRYNDGITNNGSTFGTITFIVPFDAPDRLFYVNGNNVNASGIINIVDELPLSDTQKYVEIPSIGLVEVVTNNSDAIKISNIEQYTLIYTASLNESNEISSSFATSIDILKNGVGVFTPTTATYNPANGEFVMTISQHGLDVGDRIYLEPESFVFTCDMDGNRTEHKLPSVGQPAYAGQLTINSITDNTISVNVGKSGPNINFNPTNASYEPATGEFSATVGKHSLSVGEGIVLSNESFAFTCDMDNNQSVKSYPRVGIDPFVVRSIPITSVTDTTLTFNVGASGPNKYFTPTDVNYNASNGDMLVTVGQHGLGIGRSVVLENESFAFTCDQDGDSTTHSYPRLGSDPYAGKSIVITSVGTTSHTPTNAPYNASTGLVTLTITGHTFSNGDYIKVEDGGLTYSCVLDGNTVTKSYPRAGYDYPSGRWIQISNVTTDTFDINIGSSSYTGAHTFVSATTGGIKRQTGTFTINVGNAGTAQNSLHTFVSASANAVKHEPQSPHTFVSASNSAIQHLPQSNHTFVRTTTNSVSKLPIVVENTSELVKVTNTTQYTSSVSPQLSEITYVSSSFAVVIDVLENGIGYTPTTATYNPADGEFVMTIPNHNYSVYDSIYLRPESFTFTCDMDNNKTEHNLPSIGQIAYTDKLIITSVTNNTISVNVGISGPNVEFTPTTASYDPSTGDFVMTVASHSLSVGEGIIMDVESFAFTCDMDNDQSVKSYPRLGIDPYAGRSMKITSITDTTMTVNVGTSGPNKYFTPTDVDYNALTGDMILTVSESFGLGIGRSVVLENESFAFTCDQDGNTTTHSYPRSGSDPYAEQSIVISSVGKSSHTVIDAPYDASNGDVTITISNHNFSNGDYIKLSDNSLTYTCILDGNTTQKSYPRTGIDYPSGRWLEISNVTTNTFDINIGSSPYTAAHTFVSATTNGLERQDGTFTINVGDGGSASGSIHTFVSSSIDAVKHLPQSVHTFVSASNGAVKHLPQSNHTFVRTTENSISSLPNEISNVANTIKVTDVSQYISSSVSGTLENIEFVSESVSIVYDIVKSGISSSTPTSASYDPSNGNFVITIPNHIFEVSDSIYLNPESFTFTCDMDNNKTEHNLPGVGQPAYNTELEITSTTDDTITVNVGVSGPNVSFNPTTASYDPSTGDFVMTVASHSLSVGEGIILDPQSFAFTCDMDNNQSVKSYPRIGIDPYAGRSMKITGITDTTMTVNVGVSGPNKYFTPTDVDYNALTGDMILTVSESFGLGIGRSVVLENNSIAFTCDMDGDSTTHSYPRSGSDPYAEQSILITSIGTTQHSVINAPYDASNGDVTISISNHNFNNGDYIKLSDNSLTYTCILDGNSVEKSYPRTGIDYPSGRWLEISNVTSNKFDINIGSSPYTSAHTFVSATTNGLERQDGTFTINVGDAGSASGSIHTFVSASNNAVKHEPQSPHTFVSASNGAIKHLPQSVHTFVRTKQNSVSVTKHPELYEIRSTDESTIAAYEIIKNNIPFIQSETLAYLSSSWSTASYDESKCGRDIGLIISGAAEDLVWNTLSASAVNGNYYLEYPSQAETSQLNQTLDGIEYASKLTQKLIQNIEFVTASSEATTSHTLLLDNKLLIQNETIEYISSSWSDFSYSEGLCRRDIGHIIDAAATDVLYGGNERAVQAASFYYSNPSSATGSQLNQTVDAIDYARRLSNEIIQSNVLSLPSLQTLQVAELVTQNRSLIQEETIQFLSSSWSTFEYNEAKCRRDTGYIIDAVVTDFVYGGNERSVNAGEFYYLYPSSATGSQLNQTVDGIEYAQRLTNKVINNVTLVSASIERQTAHSLLFDNRDLIQTEVISFMSSSWSNFEYDEIKCKRDVGHVIDAVATDVLYGGNQRSVNAGEFYYLYPSQATTTQSDQTITGILHAAGLANKIVQSTTLVNASSEKISAYTTILDNKKLVQNNVTEFIDQLYPYFTYDRVKCRRDTGYIVDAIATDLLWGGNERSIVAGDYYYRYPSQTTSLELTETTTAIDYARVMVNKLITNIDLVVPLITKNTNSNIRFNDTEQYSGSLSISGSNITNISSSFEMVSGIITDGIKSFTPTTATYEPSNGDFVMTIPSHTLTPTNGLYIKPESFVFTCDMDGNRSEHKLPSIGQPAYNSRLGIQSVTDNTVTINVGKSGPNVEFNPTTASYDPSNGEFVVNVGTHSLSVGEGIVMKPQSFAFTCDMDDNQSTKSYPRVGIDPFAVRSLPITSVTDTTLTFNVGTSGPNKTFTPTNADYNALTGDMILTVSESFGLGAGRSVVLENQSIAFTCDMDSDTTTHSYPRLGSDPYAGKSIEITSVGTTQHTVTDSTYTPSSGLVSLTISEHGFSNGDYIKLSDNSLTFSCLLDGNVVGKSYPRAGTDFPSGRWLEISNVTTNSFEINIGSSSYDTPHTFVSAVSNGLERQDGTFTINVGNAGSASGSIHTFVSASNEAVKHLPQSVHTFVSASNGAVKHLPQSLHTFKRTDGNSISTLPYEVRSIDSLIKVTNATQTTSSLSGGDTQVGIVSASINMINDIIRLGSDSIPFTIAKHFQTSELDNPQNITTGSYVKVSGEYVVTDELEIASSSFNQISDIIENGTGSLPTLVSNVNSNIKVTDANQYTSLVTGSSVEIGIVSDRAGLVENIVTNGIGVIPTMVSNNTNISNLIKVGNIEQYVSASGADKIQSKIVSSSFGMVINGLTNGTGSLPTITDYSELVDAPKTVLAYNLIKENIEFIKEETILFMSSSWSTFVYDEEKCRRDVGLIVSGAAEDLIWNSNSASVVNTKFYYEFPSAATGSQLNQTVTAIKYAGNLVQNIVRNYEYTTASAEVSASYDLLIANKEFIQNETIEFVSSSWSGFDYPELTCKRDVGYIVDAVATDLLYGGNERTITAGKYYYDYPSAAIVGGVPSVSQQKDPTVTAINYVKGLSTELVGGNIFVTSSNEIDFVYDSVKLNRGFIQNETVAFVNAKYPNLQYNEVSCSRDTGFIVDAVITDLKYGGNQRTLTAGEFYYRFPSKATNVQLGETTDAVTYISDLVNEIVLQNTLTIPTLTKNTENVIKTTSVTQTLGSGTTEVSVLNAVSSSFGIVMDIVVNGTGSLPATSEYTSSIGDSETLEAYSLLKSNIPFIQSETIAYLSSSWSEASYNESSCSRDIGSIVSGAAEDLLFGSVSSSVFNGKYYYDFPSQAQGTQLNQTLDGIQYASRLANNIIQSVTYVTSSIENVTSHNLIRDNKEFIQSESIAYISSSWSSFGYNEETCKRDVGYIVDAVSTDILYGGNERSVTAGDFYYRYPSNATTSELEPTTTGIEYAGDLVEKLIVNKIFVSPSVERIAGNETILKNREFIQKEVISYVSSSWSNFEYNEASCSRDTGYILDAVATDFLYGGNERSRTAGEFYYKYPSSATVAGDTSPNVNAQLYPTLDGIKYASGISQELVQNIEFVTASNEASSSWNSLRENKEFIQNEVIAYVSSSWSGVFYNEDKCKRDVGHLIDATATDLYYGGNERSVNAGSFYYLFPSAATAKGVPSTTSQLDPTVDGIRYAGKLSTKVIKNETFLQPSASVLVGADLLVGNKTMIQKETIAFLSSSWSEFEYNEASCSRDIGYIIDAVRTDLVYGGNERSVQAGTFYYYIPSVATTEQKPQTTDGIDFAKGLSEKVILKEQLIKASFQTRQSVDYLRASKQELQSIAISYTNGAFPNFEYNEDKCYRDTGFIVDAIATDLYYGGNERSIAAAESYYTGVYGSAAEVITNQQYETADVNRYLRTQFQRIVRNSPLEEFGSLIITTGHDFSYAGAGVTYKALPPNQGGAGIPDPTKEITEIAGGRVFFTSGNELGDFRIGTGLVINQATGTLQGRTFSRSLFSLVTPFSLALEG